MRKIAALILASAAGALAAAASASSTDTLVSSAPWWEKITVTMDGDGSPQSCRYETSLKPDASADCDVSSGQAAMVHKASESKGEVTRITFERRFTPGTARTEASLQPGDTLLGGQVMALAIGARGEVKDCRIVAQSGAIRPDYSCDDAAAERFQASVGGAKTPERDGYMTVLVYGHSEHMV